MKTKPFPVPVFRFLSLAFVGLFALSAVAGPSVAAAAAESIVAAPAPQDTAQSDVARWKGAVAGMEFFVIFTPADDGSGFTATLAIPLQGLSDAPLANVVYTDTEIVFTLEIAPPDGATWRATREPGAETASGELTQGAAQVPFTMEMIGADEVVELVRPQTPEPPFPYSEREVSYTNPADDTELAGTLTIPDGQGPFAAALLITGSGAQNRDEELLGHKPFLVIADHLSRNGIAVLRVDDRGVGGSTGDPAVANTEDFVGDVLTGVAFLSEQPEIDAGRIGLIGHSEGGIVAPMAAARSDDVAFILLLAGPGLPGEELMVMQLAAVQRSIGRPEENVERQMAAQKNLLELAGSGADFAAVRQAVAELTEIQLSTAPEGQRPSGEELSTAIDREAQGLMAPWWQFFLTFDPRTALREVECPVLALNGTLDTQVPWAENLWAIDDALTEGGNSDFITRELEGLNHLFQSATTGSPTEYMAIEETFSPIALDAMTEWILARFGSQQGAGELPGILLYRAEPLDSARIPY